MTPRGEHAPERETRDPLPSGVDRFADLGNAYRLRRLFGRDLRHVPSLGWLVWDGQRWGPDATGEVARRIHDVARAIELRAAELFAEAAQAQGDAERDRLRTLAKQYAAWARKSQSEQRIRACAEVAKSLVALQADDLDCDPMLFTCANGTLNLRTGQLQESSREDYITRASPVAYDREASAPLWEAVLQRALPDDDVRAYFQRRAGYSLTGDTGEQELAIAHGTGANAKSTTLETLRSVLGDYAAHCQTDTLMQTGRARGADNDLARLRGARFVTAIESGEARRLDEERIKALTGGDTITARFLYREHFEFRPAFKLWVAVNHKPEVRGTDHAIWRRLRLIPFTVTIPEDERDPALPAKLQREAAGILAWAVRGCLEWQRDGMRPPEAVLAATRDWRAEANDVARFIEECCTVLDVAKCKSSVLYAAFRQWASEQGVELMSAKAFGMRLAELGYLPDRTNAEGRIWRGIGLTAREECDA